MTILYSAGCKFCRWVARTFVPSYVNLIPTRSEEGQAIFIRLGIPENERYNNWWYCPLENQLNEPTCIIASNAGGAAWAFADIMGWEWPVRYPGVFNRLDEWVKRARPILSKFIPQGPAIKRKGGVTCTVVSL